MKKILCFIVVLALALSFTAFASDEVEFKLKSSSMYNNASAAPIDDNVITLTFEKKVDADSVDYTEVTKNGSPLTIDTDFTALLDGLNVVKIEIIGSLEYGAIYVINYGEYTSSGAPVLNDPATITFTVEDEPKVIVEKPVLLSGLETGAIKTDDSSTSVKVGSLTGFMLDVENTAVSDKEVTVVCALYDSTGLLRKIVSSTKTISSGVKDQIAVGTLIDEKTESEVNFAGGTEDGQSIAKIFVWDNMSNKSPYVAAFNFDIVTP